MIALRCNLPWSPPGSCSWRDACSHARAPRSPPRAGVSFEFNKILEMSKPFIIAMGTRSTTHASVQKFAQNSVGIRPSLFAISCTAVGLACPLPQLPKKLRKLRKPPIYCCACFLQRAAFLPPDSFLEMGTYARPRSPPGQPTATSGLRREASVRSRVSYAFTLTPVCNYGESKCFTHVGREGYPKSTRLVGLAQAFDAKLKA